MFRLSRRAKIPSPTFIQRRIWFRGFHDDFIPRGTVNDSTGNDGTGNDGTTNDCTRNDGTRNDGHGGRSNIVWDRINRLDDKIDVSIKEHGTFKVDVVKSIAELGNELRKLINDANSVVHKEFADFKSNQKLMQWQIHFLFFGASLLVIWALKDYIQIHLPAFFASKERTPPHEQPEAPPHEQPKAPQKPQK